MFDIIKFNGGYALAGLRYTVTKADVESIGFGVSLYNMVHEPSCIVKKVVEGLAGYSIPFASFEEAEEAGAKFRQLVERNLARERASKLRRRIEDRLRKGSTEDLIQVAKLLRLPLE